MANGNCHKCKKQIEEGQIYQCENDKESYHKDCGGLNEKEAKAIPKYCSKGHEMKEK